MSLVFFQKPVTFGPLFQLVSKLNYHGVDMHFHTTYSMDGVSKIKNVLQECKRKGIGIAITDHNSIEGAIKALEQNTGLFIIPGIEVTCKNGVHLMFYFPEGHLLEKFYYTEIKPLMRKNPFFLPISVEEMMNKARKYDCYLSVPHPYGPGVIGMMKEGSPDKKLLKDIDMVEVVNGACLEHENKKAVAWSKQIKKGMCAGSDGHSLVQLGKVLCFSYGKNPRQFLESIKKGNSVCIGQRENIFEEIIHTAAKFIHEEKHERGKLLELYRSRYRTEHDYLMHKLRGDEDKFLAHFHAHHMDLTAEHRHKMRKYSEFKGIVKEKGRKI
ncbi:MAG: PHP domain-containing protein [Nanoarchaeota archaeon]